MSNTSDQTTQQSKTRLIVGEIGVDTETGIIGKGHSYDNGKTFVVDDTIYGRIYHKEDHGQIWNGIQEKVEKVVKPAINSANSAYAKAQAAIESAHVTEVAVAATSQAVTEAKQGANDAMSRANSAVDETKRLGTLLDANQKDIDEQNQNLEDLRTKVSTVSQSTDSTAKELTNVASQAKANAAGITEVKSSVGEVQAAVANTQGDVSQLTLRANSLTAAVSDNKGNITKAEQRADQAVSVASDAKSEATVATQTATEFQRVAVNARSDATMAVQTASEAKVVASNASGDATTAKQTASEAKTTATNAKSEVSVVQQTATELSQRVSSVENSIETKTITSEVDLNTLTTQGLYSIQTIKQTNAPMAYWAMLSVATGADKSRVYQSWRADVDATKVYYRVKTTTWSAWTTKADQTDISNLQSQITSNSTEINQTKAAIALKAEQTDVNTLKGNVTDLQAEITTQANEIKNKVTQSDVTGMLTGYATQEYTQGLVTLKADEWNLNLTKLKTDVNAIKTTGGGVNLLSGTKDFSGWISVKGNVSTAYNGSGTINYSSIVESGKSEEILQFKFPSYTLKADTYYTLSFRAATSNNGWITTYIYGGDNGTNVSGQDTGYPPDNAYRWHLSTSGQLYTYTFKTRKDLTAGNHWLLFRNDYNAGGGTSNTIANLVLHSIMLEEGTVAHTWSPAPSDMATVTSVTNLSATVDGIKGLVETKADKSEVTQLSNLVQTKVSSGDFTSTTTQLKNMISQRVQVGDVISQINQEAGGNTLIQVSNGKGSLILDAGNTIITGKTWIPSAAIANLTADQVQAGTLSGSKVHAGDNSGNAIDMGALSDNHVGLHAYANNGDHTYIDLNGIHNYGASYDTRIQQGKITTDYLTVNGGGMIDFRAGDAGVTMDNQDIKFYNSGDVNGGISFAGSNPIADRNSGSGNELRLRYDGSFALTPISDESTMLVASTKAMGFGYRQTGSTSPDVNLTGLWVNNSGRYVRLGSWNSNSEWSRAEFNSDGVNINHAGLSIGLDNNTIHMYMEGNYATTAIQLNVDGWAWINGYCEAMGFTQHSTLSTKTRIEKADPDHMLELINNTELTTFAFKSEVAEGTEVRHIGPIIDDVNDIAQYRTPAEFIAPTKTARDDDNMIGALFGAVQALTKRIKKLEDKLNG